jgi:hypothetical protein
VLLRIPSKRDLDKEQFGMVKMTAEHRKWKKIDKRSQKKEIKKE